VIDIKGKQSGCSINTMEARCGEHAVISAT
jgi:hypothetical protein